MSDKPAEPTREQVLAGTAVYTRRWLSLYDVIVLGMICRLVWRCPRSEMLANYRRNIGARHLDLGPGTGYFLDRCRYSVPNPVIALVDLNPAVLAKASARLARLHPVTFQRNVLAPLDLGDDQRFDSIGLNFLLHCLPGGMAHKATVLDHARAHLRPDGRIFGSTVLSTGVPHGTQAAKLLDSLNAKGTFDNRQDSLEGLDAELAARFTDYHLTVRGSVALFEATG